MNAASALGPSRPRIAALTADDPVAQRVTIGSDRNGGQPLNIFLTLARNEKLLANFSRLGGHLLFSGSIPPRERELVILRVGWRAQSEYEFGQHTVIGLDAGLTPDEIERLATEGTAGWSAADAALLRLADELCHDDVVSEASWSELAGRWSDEHLLELLVLAGYYRMVSGMLNSAGVALEPTTPGWPAAAAGARPAPRADGS